MKKELLASALLATVLEMSDRAEKLGGATSIAGIASLNALQKSLQKNKSRIRALVRESASESNHWSTESLGL